MKSDKKPLIIFGKILFAIAAIASLLATIKFALYNSNDFEVLTYATKLLIQGVDIYDPQIRQQYQIGSNYLPSCYLILTPFVLFDWPIRQIIWILTNLVITILLARELTTIFKKEKYFWLILGLILISSPWQQF